MRVEHNCCKQTPASHPRILLLVVLLLTAFRAYAGSATLAWEPVSNASVVGYMVYYGPGARNYTAKIDAGKVTSRTIVNLSDGATYHFAVTAYDAARKETAYSNDVATTIPIGAPVAAFAASATTGVAPFAINFINSSTGNITSYAWTFGDGTTSTVQNPAHVYSKAGPYTVSLTVAGPGGTNTRTLANYVTVTTTSVTDVTPPSAPSSLAATAGGATSISLRWNPSTDDKGVTGYRIERCQGVSCTAFVQIATTTGTTYSNTSLAAGTSYGYRVRATDAVGRLSTYSNTARATTTSGAAGTNVALAANGAIATASSIYSSGHMPAAAIDNKRSGAVWGNGGNWADGTVNVFPDWIQVKFNGNKTIDRVVVYSVQDNYQSPVEPTATMTFTRYGLNDFLVQGFNGASWVTLATITGNNLVKRTVTFAPYTTDRVRILVNRGGGGYARVTEIEAWTSSVSTVAQNFALAANGGVATASSTQSGGYLPASTIDNRRSGAGWGNGGGWIDGTVNAFPDWLQVKFNTTKTIDRVVVYSVQDNFSNPVEPTDTMTFSLYGLTDFLVQGFNGASWVTLGTVSGNNRVKRTVTFTPYATDRIRVLVSRGGGGYSRMTELEAWGK